jgi:hypothetical protein
VSEASSLQQVVRTSLRRPGGPARRFNILDSTGALPYEGDVLVRGQRIVSVGPKISEEDLRKCRVVQGRGRTLMSGLGRHSLISHPRHCASIPDDHPPQPASRCPHALYVDECRFPRRLGHDGRGRAHLVLSTQRSNLSRLWVSILRAA